LVHVLLVVIAAEELQHLQEMAAKKCSLPKISAGSPKIIYEKGLLVSS